MTRDGGMQQAYGRWEPTAQGIKVSPATLARNEPVFTLVGVLPWSEQAQKSLAAGYQLTSLSKAYETCPFLARYEAGLFNVVMGLALSGESRSEAGAGISRAERKTARKTLASATSALKKVMDEAASLRARYDAAPSDGALARQWDSTVQRAMEAVEEYLAAFVGVAASDPKEAGDLMPDRRQLGMAFCMPAPPASEMGYAARITPQTAGGPLPGDTAVEFLSADGQRLGLTLLDDGWAAVPAGAVPPASIKVLTGNAVADAHTVQVDATRGRVFDISMNDAFWGTLPWGEVSFERKGRALVSAERGWTYEWSGALP